MIVEAFKAGTRKDAKAMKIGVKKLQQKLNNTKDKLMMEIQSGGFRIDVHLKITCAIPRVRKILSKLLRIEMENYHIIMTMGMYQIEPPWISVCLIQTY
jgi:hypothetical protein